MLPSPSGPVVTGPIKIQLPGGETAHTRIAGQVFDPGLAPSSQEQIIYGYITKETAGDWQSVFSRIADAIAEDG